MPRTRPIELPVALLLATAAFAFSVAGACAVLLAGLVVLAGHAEVVLRAGWPTWCAAAALGCANAAGLLALTRHAGGLHPLAVAAAWLLGAAVPVSGAPVPAALAAAVAPASPFGSAPAAAPRRTPCRPPRCSRSPRSPCSWSRSTASTAPRPSGPPRARPSRRPGPPSARRRGRGADPAPPRPRPSRVLPRARRAPFDGAWHTLAPAVRRGSAASSIGARVTPRRVASRPHGIAVERGGTVASVAHEARKTARRAGRCDGASTSAGDWSAPRPAGAPPR